MPFLKKEEHKRVVLNILAPTWDGNFSWVVLAGGSLFVIWPVVYSTVFSGIYAVMFSLLFITFLRPPGFDYRGKIDNNFWRWLWDFALFLSSIVSMFIFGFIFGNLLVGLPFHFDNIFLRDFYTGNFWGLLNWSGILCGLCSVSLLAMHGACYITLRSEGDLKILFRKLQIIFGVIFLILFTATGFVITYHVKGYVLDFTPKNPDLHTLDNKVHLELGAWINSYQDYWWKFFGPLLAYLGVITSIIASISRFNFLSFCGSILAVAGTILTAGFALFPFIVPSSTNPNQSLTVWNATSSYYALSILLIIVGIFAVIITAYKIFAYKTSWITKPTLNADDISKDTHNYY